MSNYSETVIDFLGRCDQHTTLSSLISDFSLTLNTLGFKYFMMTRLPAIGESAEPYIIAHTWPKEWLDRYRAENYFWKDPVSAYSLTSGRPFSWKEARDGSKRTRAALKVASDAKGVGLIDGIGFPMGDPSSVQAVVSIAADRPVDIDALGRKLLHTLCIHAELKAVELLQPLHKDQHHLTEKEKEVLRWIANGKSAWETSQILSVAESTVNFHVQQAKSKLNASTQTHAVAMAIRDRHIIL